jgi:DNA-binding MarR family transcriptional regulator
MLDELSSFVSAANGVNEQPPSASDEHRDHRAEVLRVIKSREARGKHFPADWFSNPAWDLLLFLYEARLSGTNVTVGDVGNGTGTRPTTTIRWLEILESEALLDRRRDTVDTRRVYITLNDRGAAAMRAYFNDMTALR